VIKPGRTRIVSTSSSTDRGFQPSVPLDRHLTPAYTRTLQVIPTNTHSDVVL
jgi:hypothetical protein